MFWQLLLKLKSHDPEVRLKTVQSLADTEDERIFDPLVKAAAGDPDQRVKAAAIAGLGVLPEDKVTTFLLQKLHDPDPVIRRAAIEGLRSRVEEQVLAALVDALRDPDPAVSGRASQMLDRQHWRPRNPDEELWHAIARGGFVEAVTQHGPRAIEPLATILKTGVVPLEVKAIRALAEIRDDHVVDTLLPCLESPERSVCVAAVETLSGFNNPKIVDPILSLLTHSDQKVRVAAIEAAARLNLKQAAPGVEQMLKDPNWDVRTAAAIALGKIGNAQAIGSLVAIIKDRDSGVRQAAIAALGHIGDPGAIAPLVATLVHADDKVRASGVTALQMINPRWQQTAQAREAAPVLRAACDSNDPSIRFTAVNLLQQLGESAIPQIVTDTPRAMAETGHKQRLVFAVFAELLGDADCDLRLAAVQVLGRLGDPRAAELLKNAQADTDERVRRVAAAVPAAPEDQSPGRSPASVPPAMEGIAEIALHAEAGEMLYEWPSPGTNNRVPLFDPLFQYSESLAQDLSLGRVGRLNAETSEGRIIFSLQPSRRLFLRISAGQEKT